MFSGRNQRRARISWRHGTGRSRTCTARRGKLQRRGDQRIREKIPESQQIQAGMLELVRLKKHVEGDGRGSVGQTTA